MQPSPLPIAKLKSLHVVSRGQLPPIKWSYPFVAYPPYDDFKISLPTYYAPPSPINMATMIRQHTKFPRTASSPRKPDHQAIHGPTANFRSLSRGSVTNPMLITAFDAYLTPRSSSGESDP